MADPQGNFAHCEALVREADPDRYWASLFAPADKRPHLYALYAFNFVPDALEESYGGDPNGAMTFVRLKID